MYEVNNILFENIDLKNMKITYNDFTIDPAISFMKQKWSFKEDIVQICLDVFIVDIGFYPEFDPKGSFLVEVIKNNDWTNPLFKKKCKKIPILKKYLQEAIDFVDSIMNE